MISTRKRALEIIVQVVKDKGHANLLLRNTINDYSIKDKALITNLVYGTLKKQTLLRYQWKEFVKGNIDTEIGLLLDMSVYQLFFLERIPDYAIINEAIEIAKAHHYGKYKNLVTAVLNKVKENQLKIVKTDTDENLSIMTTYPLWLIKMLKSHYGEEIAYKICLDNLNEKPLALRINTLKTSKTEIMKNPLFKETALSNTGVTYEGSIFDSTEYKEGKILVQSLTSQHISEVLDPKEGDHCLDMCSAPGSKTMHMAALMNDKGTIDACDIHPQRVGLIDKMLEFLGIKCVKTHVIDSRTVDSLLNVSSYDKVLVDVPCSGIGVVGNKPDILFNLLPESIDGLVTLQKEIIDTAVKMVKVKGVLVYSTCTLNKKENEKQIEYLLNKYSNYELVEEKTFFPMNYDSDGFYYAKLLRKE